MMWDELEELAAQYECNPGNAKFISDFIKTMKVYKIAENTRVIIKDVSYYWWENKEKHIAYIERIYVPQTG